MYRNIVLGLLLANILLLAWQSWVVPSDAAFPGRISPVGEQQLVLVGVEPTRAGVEPAAGLCTRLGPFADLEMADAVGRQLEGDAFGVRRTSQAGQIWVGYWVQLVDLRSAADAAQIMDRLKRAGLLDAYIFQTEPTINISLGVFRSRNGAERVAGLARGLSLRPEMTDRYQPGVEHWLTVESPLENVLDLSEIQLGSTQILRLESVACDVDGTVSARIQP